MTRNPLGVAVVGLGPMGFPMATNLMASDIPVEAWNRSPGPAARFQRVGGRTASSPADLRGDIVLSVLPDVDQLEPLLPDLAARGHRTVVVMSTSTPRKVVACAEKWAGILEFVDAPVSGGVEGARSGTLSIMVGGSTESFDRTRPVLECIGATVERVGALGAGMVAKLCNQVIVGATLAALGEAFALGEAGGLDLEQLTRLLQGGLADSALLRRKAPNMVRREYAGGGSSLNQVKDLRYAVEEASRLGTASLVGAAALTLFETTVAAGHGLDDHSAVHAVARPASAP